MCGAELHLPTTGLGLGLGAFSTLGFALAFAFVLTLRGLSGLSPSSAVLALASTGLVSRERVSNTG